MLLRLLGAVLATALFLSPAKAAFDVGDIICETSTTTGTGTLNLAGAVTNYLTFASQIANGNTVPYHIVASDGKLETGIGTFTDATPDTLSRTADWSSDGSGAELTLPAGTHTVCLGPISSSIVHNPTVANITFDADATYDIGTSTVGVNDLHFGSGGIINFDGGDITLTHAANTLTFAGTSNGIFLEELIAGSSQITFRQTGGVTVVPDIQSVDTDSTAAMGVARFANSDNAARIFLGKSRGATVGDFTIITDGDELGAIYGNGADGTDFAASGFIKFMSAGAPGSGDMPGAIEFGVTPDAAETATTRFTLGSDGCLYSHNATSTNTGNCGDGQINADAVYDDNTALTSMPLSDTFRNTGTFSVEEWEQKNNRNRGKIERQVPKIGPDGQPVKDADGIVVTEKIQVDDIEEHHAARHFKKMLDQGFDPRDPKQWVAKMREDKVLPGMPTEQEWNERGEFSLGELYSRMWLTLDMMGLQIETQQKKLDELEARISDLEKRNGNSDNRP